MINLSLPPQQFVVRPLYLYR